MTDRALQPINRLDADWRATRRSAASKDALRQLAAAEEVVAALCLADLGDLGDLVDALRHPKDAADRARAARVIQAMLRSQGVHPLVPRAVLQAILPGLVSIARRLSWGAGGDWNSGGAFFVDLLTTAWEVVVEWAGDDRDYAVLDLLSAIRCRLRRQLLSQRAGHERVVPGLDGDVVAPVPWRNGGSDLDELARTIDELAGNGLDPIDAAILYGNGVLGMTITELSQMTGMSRRHLGGRRQRALHEIVA
ncbi:MAG TPA: hypothetical protein VHX40_09410 [Acidimicrobiales bacterium]|jgi:hypothetical protein|nr:hypothetical protein [Acidimicrobiales bacterium]